MAKLAPDYAEAGLDPSSAATGSGRAALDQAMTEVVEETKPPVNAAPSRNAGALRMGRPGLSLKLTCYRWGQPNDGFVGLAADEGEG